MDSLTPIWDAIFKGGNIRVDPVASEWLGRARGIFHFVQGAEGGTHNVLIVLLLSRLHYKRGQGICVPPEYAF